MFSMCAGWEGASALETVTHRTLLGESIVIDASAAKACAAKPASASLVIQTFIVFHLEMGTAFFLMYSSNCDRSGAM